MFFTRRANSLPRLASSAAFLCLVVAHFEWPAISAPYVSCGAPCASGRAGRELLVRTRSTNTRCTRARSEERRVGKECRAGGSPEHCKGNESRETEEERME